MIAVSDIDAATLAAGLMNDSWRCELWDAMKAERGTSRSLTRAFECTVAHMAATAEQLRELIRVFQAEHRDDGLAELLFHPQMPEDVLIQFCERGEFIESLGHRHGPRRLLARVAELHAYPEAVVSLAVDLYRDPGVSSDEFAAFVRTQARQDAMLRSLAELDGSDVSKEAIYEGLLVGFAEAAAYHARHLANSKRFSAQRLGAFLDLQDDPRVLTLLLGSELEENAKKLMVEARASARSDHPAIATALNQHRARARAAAPDLRPEAATELFTARDPEVLLMLAGNPLTPRDLLEALCQTKGSAYARSIRNRARVNLRGSGR